MSDYYYFPGFVVLTVKMHLTACVLFDHDFHTKASRAKNLFEQPLRAWSSAAFYFRAYRESKKREN